MNDTDRRQTIMYLYKKIRGTGEHSFNRKSRSGPYFPMKLFSEDIFFFLLQAIQCEPLTPRRYPLS